MKFIFASLILFFIQSPNALADFCIDLSGTWKVDCGQGAFNLTITQDGCKLVSLAENEDPAQKHEIGLLDTITETSGDTKTVTTFNSDWTPDGSKFVLLSTTSARSMKGTQAMAQQNIYSFDGDGNLFIDQKIESHVYKITTGKVKFNQVSSQCKGTK